MSKPVVDLEALPNVAAPTLGELREREADAKRTAEAAGESFRVAREKFRETNSMIDSYVSAGNLAKIEELGKSLPALDADQGHKERLHHGATMAYQRARRDRAIAELPVLREQSVSYAVALDVATASLAGEIRNYKTARNEYVACLRDAEVPGQISTAPGFEKPRTSFGGRVLGVLESHL